MVAFTYRAEESYKFKSNICITCMLSTFVTWTASCSEKSQMKWSQLWSIQFVVQGHLIWLTLRCKWTPTPPLTEITSFRITHPLTSICMYHSDNSICGPEFKIVWTSTVIWNIIECKLILRGIQGKWLHKMVIMMRLILEFSNVSALFFIYPCDFLKTQDFPMNTVWSYFPCSMSPELITISHNYCFMYEGKWHSEKK